MDIGLFWKVYLSAAYSEDVDDRVDVYEWMDDYETVLRQVDNEMVYHFGQHTWVEAEKNVRNLGADLPNLEDIVKRCRVLHGLGSRRRSWQTAAETLLSGEERGLITAVLDDWRVHVSVAEIQISVGAFNQAIRDHHEHVTDDVLIEIVAKRKAA
jgi:hypothetical protein